MITEQAAVITTVSKIRFGDPVMSLGIGSHSILHGSIMGRLIYHQLGSRDSNVLVDIANEMARAITLSSDGTTYYIANGDEGWHTYAENGLSPLRTFAVKVNGNHSDICERSYTFQAKGYNCVIYLASDDEASNSKT